MTRTPDLEAAGKLARSLTVFAARVREWLVDLGHHAGDAAVLQVMLYLEAEDLALEDCAPVKSIDQHWAIRENRTPLEARSLRLGGGRQADGERWFLYVVRKEARP